MIFQNKYHAFWKWFENHSEALWYYENNTEILDKLHKELHKINRNLTFEFGPHNTKRDFTISADGIQEAFPFVEKLFDAKPVLRQWNIQKFRQRGDISCVITIQDFTLYPENIKYVLFPDGNKIGLILFIKGFDDKPDIVTDLAYIFLDTALGEYDVETKIRGIDFRDYHTAYFELSKSIESLRTDFDTMYTEIANQAC